MLKVKGFLFLFPFPLTLFPTSARSLLYASDYLKRLLAEVALVRVQDPIQLSQYSEPKPDIAIVRIDARKYINHHPAPNEIFLLIEVPDTRLDADRKKHLFILKPELLTTGF